MKKKSLFVFWSLSLCFSEFLIAQDKNYYLSATGNDSNDGLTIKNAWRTIDKINGINFKPGDSLFLEGGTVFHGTIQLTSDDNGSVGNPVVFSSFGKGKATINAGDGEGLLGVNSSFLRIISLRFEGSGVANNKGSGIHFYANDSLNAPSDIEIIDCDAKGFKNYGIGFGANDTISYKGYQSVRITHCNVSENGEAGIASYGSYLGFQHGSFYIAYCKAFNNRGNPIKTQNHSGNGIVMGMVDGLLIEYCEAYENGADNRCTAGGPVGIWVWMCKNAIIQHCVSHDNHAGLTKDGGGFDIDGGASNCILQYNYSYNNEGAGYLLAEYGAIFPFTNNIIRFNISINDGRKNGYGAITVWGTTRDHSVTNTYVYNNTIFVNDQKIIIGKPAVIRLIGPNYQNVVVANNIFVTKGSVNAISSDTAINTSALLLLHNNYFSYTNQYNFEWGKKKFNSLQSWFRENLFQEKWRGKSMWMNINPLFKEQKELTDLSAKNSEGYFKKEGLMMSPTSLLRKELFPLKDHFKILSNTKDFGKNDLPSNGSVTPGATIH